MAILYYHTAGYLVTLSELFSRQLLILILVIELLMTAGTKSKIPLSACRLQRIILTRSRMRGLAGAGFVLCGETSKVEKCEK